MSVHADVNRSLYLPAGIDNRLNMSQPSKEELKEMCKGGMGSQAAQDMDSSGGGGGTAFGTGFDSSNTGDHNFRVSVGTF